MGNIHLHLSPKPTLGDGPFLRGIHVHSEDGLDHHLKLLFLADEMKRRLHEREVEGGAVGPLANVLMTIEAVVRNSIELQRIILHVECEVISLALVQTCGLLRCLLEPCRYLIARIGLDGRIRLNDAIALELLYEVIYFCIFNRLGNVLRYSRTSHKGKGTNGEIKPTNSHTLELINCFARV